MTADAQRQVAHPDDPAILAAAEAAVQRAGAAVTRGFPPPHLPTTRDEVFAALAAGDARSLASLQDDLVRARRASWADEAGTGPLPAGEHWVADAVEGNINQVHGMADWCVSATLVRDGVPVLAAVHVPSLAVTYTARRGGGAFRDGAAIHASKKTNLDAALVGTGQALPGEDATTRRRLGAAITAMLERALVVHMSVPATLQLINVADGRRDAFWQPSRVRSGLVAGALLVAEAGGVVTDTRGRPWTLASDDFLAAAPGIHAASVAILSTL
jgi:myo-inositol-1(or 4)-monophosphatase